MTRLNVPLTMNISLAIPTLPKKLPTSGERWRRRGDGPSVRNRCFALSCVPSCWTLSESSGSELGFCCSRHEVKPLNRGSLSVCLSLCVQRAALKAPPPFGRTLSFQDSATRLSEVRTPVPIASLGPLPQILSSRRGSG